MGGNLLKQPIFSRKFNNKFKADSCKNSDVIDACGLYLPNHQYINEKHVLYMLEEIGEFIGKYG